jgi:hypothetical protein
MVSSGLFRGLGCWLSRCVRGWADTTGLGHWVFSEGMLLLGHAVPLVVVRLQGLGGQFIHWTALLGASAGSGATPTPCGDVS